jgi:NAD(P)-dependent dehydrogenase (short-subunit alcohol dehydrogenase family)
VREPSSFPKDIDGADKVQVVKLDAGSLTDATEVSALQGGGLVESMHVAEMQVAAQLKKDNVSLDVVIANAAINTPDSFANFEDVDPELVDLHLQVNVSWRTVNVSSLRCSHGRPAGETCS